MYSITQTRIRGKGQRMNSRRIAHIAVVAALVFTLFAAPAIIRASSDKLHFSELAAPQDELSSIISARVPAAFGASISMGGAPLFSDQSAGRYYYSLTDSDYDPVVRLVGADNLKIVFLKTAITPKSISENAAIPFLLYDARRYQRCELFVTTLPLLSVRTGSVIGEADMPGLMQLYDNGSGSLMQSHTYIHVRGGSSQGYPKKSYKLSLKTQAVTPRHLPLLDLRNDDDWILYAAYNEPEKLRSALATGLWNDTGASRNSFGIRFGSECRFVELFINGAYNGLYQLMTPVDAKQIQLKESADPSRCEYLYRSVSYAPTSPADFLEAPNAVIAGRYELREPDDAGATHLKWQPLSALISLTDRGSDEEFEADIFAMTEEDNIVNYWLFVNAIYAEDNVEKNVNLAAKYRGGRYVMLMGAWDLDLTFGNIYTEDEVLCCRVDPNLAYAQLWNSALMMRALEMNAGGIRAAIAKRWEELRSGALSEDAVLAQLARLEQDVYGSGAILRDHLLWPDAAFAPDTAALSMFISERLAYMDGYVGDVAAGVAP